MIKKFVNIIFGAIGIIICGYTIWVWFPCIPYLQQKCIINITNRMMLMMVALITLFVVCTIIIYQNIKPSEKLERKEGKN